VCMLGGYRCRCMGWSSATSSAVSRFWSRRGRSGSRKRAARAPSGTMVIASAPNPPTPAPTTCSQLCLSRRCRGLRTLQRPPAYILVREFPSVVLAFSSEMAPPHGWCSTIECLLRSSSMAAHRYSFGSLQGCTLQTAIAMTLDMLGVASHTSRLLTVARYALDQREVAWWRGTGAG
jgi:hypothetical protein